MSELPFVFLRELYFFYECTYVVGIVVLGLTKVYTFPLPLLNTVFVSYRLADIFMVIN